MSRTLVGLICGCLVWAPAAHAEEPVTTPQQLYAEEVFPPRPAHIAQFDDNCSNLGDRDPFTAWKTSFQFMAGYFPKTGMGPQGPAFDYVPIGLRVGCMLNDPWFEDWCIRGCAELLLEYNYLHVIKDFGNYATGPNLIARYNFVQPEWVLVPYFQVGAGFVFTDAHKTPLYYQGLIGQAFEFFLRGELGARLMITECLSLDAEWGYQHISNAGLGKKNGGVNNVGFSLGFTYIFGKWR